MAVSILDQFDYRGKKQNFKRDAFDTIADMVAFSENYLPPVFETYCYEDGNKYRYRETNDIDPVLGKWRVVTEGGISELPTASATVKGAVKIGDGLTMNGEVLSADVQSDENFTAELKEKLEDIDMSTKVDIEEGKGLSTNDLTDELKAQYDKAEENVQSDWGETDETVDSFIKGKPTKLSDFDNDEEFITKAVDNLENYYKASETYTQSEVNALVNAINSFELKKVDVLPTEDINTHCIYFVPHGDTEGNLFDEFIYIDEKWENLGPAVLPTSGKAEEVTYENPKHLELDNVQKALDAVIERAESVPKPTTADKVLLSAIEDEKPVWTEVDKDEVGGTTQFIGTQEEWDNLTLEEKAKYDGKEVIFTNDSSDPEPSPSITKTDVTFFIDYENGDDANDGLSEDTPLKTLDFQRIASAYNKYTRFGFNLMSDYPEPVEILNTSIVVIKSNGASSSTPLEDNYTLKGGIYFGNVAEAFIQFVNVSSENNASGVLIDFQNCGIAYLGYSKITYSRNSNGRAVRVLKCSGISINCIEIKNTTTKVLYGITVGTSCVYMLQGSKVSSIDSSVDYGYSFVDGGGIVYIPGNTYKQITPKALQDGIGAIFVDGQLITTKYENTYEGEKIDLQNKPTVKSVTPSGGAYTKPSGVTTAVQGGCAYGDKYIQLFNTGYFGVYSIKDFDKGTNSKSPLAYGQLGSFDANNHANSLTFGEKYSDTDEFPLLYLTGYRDSIDSAEQLGSCCYVDRLINNGSGYTSEHIQTIYIDYSTYSGTKFVETFHYHNYLVDIENGYLYTFAPKWRSNGSQSEHDSENRYYLTRFKIPETTNPTVVLTANDILAQFELPYDATFTQGATIHNGFLYHVFGQGNSTVHPNCIRVYNLMTGKESAKIDCSKFNWQVREPESLTVYDNKLLVMVQNMYIHYLQFA